MPVSPPLAPKSCYKHRNLTNLCFWLKKLYAAHKPLLYNGVMQWNLEEGKNIQQSLEELQKSIEKLGAKKTGVYCVECDTYQPSSGRQGKLLNIISSSEYPLSRFARFEEGTIVTTDGMLPNLLSKLRLFWQQRKGARIECRGNRYGYSDFTLKIGVVTHSTNARGIAIEVEYTPCIYVKECWGLLTELLQSIIRTQIPTSEPQLFQQMKPTDVYTPEHTCLQYIELFNNCRKVAA